MENIIKLIIWISLFLLPSSSFAWNWIDLWQTADQQGVKLLKAGKAKEASQVFKNGDWQAVAQYRSGNYSQAFQQFHGGKTSDDQYNAGNAAAFMGHYQEAINAYDKSIALNPNNTDAITNREIIKNRMNKQKQQQNNSSANNNKKEDKKENNSSSQQNTAQNNSSQKNNNDKQNAQNNQQNNQQKGTNHQAQAINTPQTNKLNQTLDKQKSDSKQQSEITSAADHLQTQDEDKKQLLRRIADDPGGLLRQKFLRDYFRRHSVGESSDQGDN